MLELFTTGACDVADVIKICLYDVLCCKNGICCCYGPHTHCLIFVVWIVVFQHKPPAYFLSGMLPAFAATFKSQQFPAPVISVSCRAYLVLWALERGGGGAV
jgi:hypothetical protein